MSQFNTDGKVTTYINGILAIKNATIANKKLAQLKADNTVTLFVEKTNNALYFARVSRSNLDESGNTVKCRIRIVEITMNDTQGYHAGSTAYVKQSNGKVTPTIETSKDTLSHELMRVVTAKHALHMSKTDSDGNHTRLGYDDTRKAKYKAMIAEYSTDENMVDSDAIEFSFDELDKDTELE